MPTRIKNPEKKALLALDGGGIRGLLSLQILARIEFLARKRSGNPHMRLCELFDFVGGTSTGGIIAAALSIGLTVSEIERFYLDNASAMFTRNSNWIKRLTTARYQTEALEQKLQEIFGFDTTLGSPRLRTLLMLVMLNASTSSPWPLSSNPFAQYNDLQSMGSGSNLHIPLWKLVRASAAAPFFFEPESFDIGGKQHLFFDGGLTPYNNPAFKLFQMATLPEYRLGWKTGVERLLLVSVGTGLLPRDLASETVDTMNFIKALPAAVHALMYTSAVEQDLVCRSFGRVIAGGPIDSEVGTLANSESIGGRDLYTYARYNADLSPKGLAKLGLSYGDDVTFTLDNIACIDACVEVGRLVAEQTVQPEHFDGLWSAGDDLPIL